MYKLAANFTVDSASPPPFIQKQYNKNSQAGEYEYNHAAAIVLLTVVFLTAQNQGSVYDNNQEEFVMGLLNDIYDRVDEEATKREIEKQANSAKEAKAKKAAEEIKKKKESSAGFF